MAKKTEKPHSAFFSSALGLLDEVGLEGDDKPVHELVRYANNQAVSDYVSIREKAERVLFKLSHPAQPSSKACVFFAELAALLHLFKVRFKKDEKPLATIWDEAPKVISSEVYPDRLSQEDGVWFLKAVVDSVHNDMDPYTLALVEKVLRSQHWGKLPRLTLCGRIHEKRTGSYETFLEYVAHICRAEGVENAFDVSIECASWISGHSAASKRENVMKVRFWTDLEGQDETELVMSFNYSVLDVFHAQVLTRRKKNRVSAGRVIAGALSELIEL